jgi:hypothetical protein
MASTLESTSSPLAVASPASDTDAGLQSAAAGAPPASTFHIDNSSEEQLNGYSSNDIHQQPRQQISPIIEGGAPNPLATHDSPAAAAVAGADSPSTTASSSSSAGATSLARADSMASFDYHSINIDELKLRAEQQKLKKLELQLLQLAESQSQSSASQQQIHPKEPFDAPDATTTNGKKSTRFYLTRAVTV